MNQGPILFLGMFAALALSWFGMIVQPQLQLGRATPGTNTLTRVDAYPQARPGLAQQGLQVYRSLGCATCHSQQVRQGPLHFDLVLTAPGTNTAEVVEATHRLRPDLPKPEIGSLLSKLPVTVLAGLVNKAHADAAAESLSTNGAKVEVRMLASGADIARGWGRGRTVAADFLWDRPALPGHSRLGPDLANVGLRLPNPDWHYRHLYDPKSLVPASVMPPYRFLFERRKAGPVPTPDALKSVAESAATILAGSRTNWTTAPGGAAVAGPADAEEIVPTDDAHALVAYLLSLRADVPIAERPLAYLATGPTNAAPAQSTAVTNPPAAFKP